MATSTLKPPSCFQTIYVRSSSASVTVSANSTATASITNSLTDWTPIGVVGVYQDKPLLVRYSYSFSHSGNTATASVGLRNTSGSSVTVSVTVAFLWRKN